MEQFEQPLEGIFRDGVPNCVLRAFAPLYQALANISEASQASRDCYFWRGNPLKCVDEDIRTVTAFMQASEGAFRLCPQQSASLLKCHQTEPCRAMFFCRDEEWEWRTCLMEKAGVRFWPYANKPNRAKFSNGGQTENFHLEDRHFFTYFSFWQRKEILASMRARELETIQQRRNWKPDGGDATDYRRPKSSALRPANLPSDEH